MTTVLHRAAASREGGQTEVPPLAGFTVGITAARRADELATMLRRRGARVQLGAALRIVPVADDTELAEATRRLIADPPDVTVVSTGIGFRGWVSAAEGWYLGADLLAALGRGRVIVRGPKARGAVRAAGLVDAWSPPSESSAEVLEHLLDAGVGGLRVAVQLHGEPLPDLVEALGMAGAEVIEVPVYRWLPPVDPGPLDGLIDSVLAGAVHVLTFTSAPAAAGLLARAGTRGLRDALLAALRGPVVVVCVGPVTAAPLIALDVPTVQPQRSRLGAMVRELEADLPHRARVLPVAGHRLELRGHAVLLDGVLHPVPTDAMAVLRALARRPGRVVTRDELRGALAVAGSGAGADRPGEAAVEAAVDRLRAVLDAPRMVQALLQRGYRLALDPAAGPVPAGGHCLHGDDW